MHTTSTSLLIRLRRPHDQVAWSRFVELYTPLIFFWGRRAGLAADDAADLVQDVMLVMVRRLPSLEYDAAKSFRGWLRTVTLNKFRERFRRRRVLLVDVADDELNQAVDPDPAPGFWECDYSQQLIARALEMLAPEFRPATWSACRRHLLDGLSADQAARESGVSVWTVYAARARLLKRLREELAGLLD